MKRGILPIFLAASIVFTAAFGLFGLSLMEHGEFSTCPFSILSGNECPPAGNPLTLAAHHISGLQTLTQSIVGVGATLLIVSLLLLALIPLTSLRLFQKDLSNLSYQKYYPAEKLDFIPNRQFLDWLAAHNKRYPHAFYRVHAVV